MSYSPKRMVTQDMTAKENHWHVTIDVYTITNEFVETIDRCVFSGEGGKQEIAYKRRKYQIKKMRPIRQRGDRIQGGEARNDIFALKLPPECNRKAT